MKRFHVLLLILIFIFLVRLPFLFEPHWYLDEAVYLIVAQAIKRGAIIYRDIYDLKPPLIYFTYFFAQSHLFWVRLVATFSVLLTSLVIFRFQKSLLSVTLFGLLASSTIFEGGIANTEIFMILPITLGALLVYQKKTSLFWVGILFGLAFLFKTVALFDLLAIAFFLFLTAGRLKQFLKQFIFLVGGFLIPLSLVSFYFFINQAFLDFLNSVFLYNASYINPQNILIKIFFLTTYYLLLTTYRNKVTDYQLLLYLWFGTSLFGALFGGRPYPHYLIQVLPPFSLIVAHSLSPIRQIGQIRKILSAFLATFLLIIVFKWGNFYLYPIRSYYKNFFLYTAGRRSQEEYLKFFNPLLPSIYQTASYLKENSTPHDSAFVLADYPQIYELSGVKPATRFMATSHLDIVPGAKEEIINSLNENHPKFMVVFTPRGVTLPQLEGLINRSYYLSFTSGNINVFQPR